MSLTDKGADFACGQYTQKVQATVIHPKVDVFFKDFIEKIPNTGIKSCGAKVYFLRKFLQTQKIPFNLVLSVMERHNCTDQEVIKGSQLTDLLHDIYYAANKLDFMAHPWNWSGNQPIVDFEFDPEEMASRLGSLLWMIFDPIHAKSISVLELKIALILLCCTNSCEELVQYSLLQLLIDHNRCIHQSKFRSMAMSLLKFFHSLDEGIKWDSETISAIVGVAFEKVTGLAGLSDTQFYGFWNVENPKNPKEISYYLKIILHSRRLEAAATSVVQEGICCNGCNLSPIRGFRYKCSRCPSVDLCLLCHLRGDYKADRHNPESHKMIEIQEPGAEGKRENVLTKLLKVFYFMRSKRRSTDGDTETDDKRKSHSAADEDEIEKTLTNCQDKLDEVVEEREEDGPSLGKNKLINVIEMLSMENRIFQKNLGKIQTWCNPDSEFHRYLEQHKNILTEQIEQLRVIWKQSDDIEEGKESAVVTPVPVQKFHSTPFRPHTKAINWDLTAFDASGACSEAEKSKYIRGEELNKTYFEANRSTRSLQEISTWLHMRESFCREMMSFQESLENAINCQTKGKPSKRQEGDEEPGLRSFKVLLHRVRDILEDTYSDNAQLSTVTRQLETVLDNIIGEEEKKRQGAGSVRKEVSPTRN